MYSVRIEVEPERCEGLLANLWEAGTLGVIEGTGEPRIFVLYPALPQNLHKLSLIPILENVSEIPQQCFRICSREFVLLRHAYVAPRESSSLATRQSLKHFSQTAHCTFYPGLFRIF
jgi:hypothetical protein